jgi:sugar lactone lactonase YvrE
MRRSTRLLVETRGTLMRLCAGLFVAACWTAAASGQTQATAVPLVLPTALVFDAQGNLYFAETGNHVIRKFSVGGGLTTVVGNGVQGFAGDSGPATAAELDSPSGLAMDAAGNLYLADTHNHRVREVAASTGAIPTRAGDRFSRQCVCGGHGHPSSAADRSGHERDYDRRGQWR